MMLSVVLFTGLLQLGIAREHVLCSTDVDRNSFCVGENPKMCDWLRNKQHRLCHTELGDNAAPEQQGCAVKVASSVPQAVDSNYKIIDAFFANEALIRGGGKPPASPEPLNTAADTAADTPTLQRPEGMEPKSWSRSLPKAGVVPFFNSETAYLFNSMWQHAFSIPDYQLLGLPNSLAHSGNSSSEILSLQFGTGLISTAPHL